MYADIALILDEEKNDRKFAKIPTTKMKGYFPDYKLNIVYETLPHDPETLEDKTRKATYRRQIWSTCFLIHTPIEVLLLIWARILYY